MNKMVSSSQWTDQARNRDPVRQMFDRLFEGSLLPNSERDDSLVVTSQWAPLVDIREEPDRFELYADIPGVDPQDIEVQMDRGLLTIKGERRANFGGDAGRFSRIERLHGTFHRRFVPTPWHTNKNAPDESGAFRYSLVIRMAGSPVRRHSPSVSAWWLPSPISGRA